MWKNLYRKMMNPETVSYVFFGVLTTAVDWIVYPISRYFGASVAAATFWGWASAVVFAFVTNKIFVFRSQGWGFRKLAREFVSFVACRAFTVLVSMAAMVVLADFMHWNEYLAKALVSVGTLAMNYIFSKLFIFKKTSEREL